MGGKATCFSLHFRLYEVWNAASSEVQLPIQIAPISLVGCLALVSDEQNENFGMKLIYCTKWLILGGRDYGWLPHTFLCPQYPHLHSSRDRRPSQLFIVSNLELLELMVVLVLVQQDALGNLEEV